jgi:hypothetical protein
MNRADQSQRRQTDIFDRPKLARERSTRTLYMVTWICPHTFFLARTLLVLPTPFHIISLLAIYFNLLKRFIWNRVILLLIYQAKP